MPNDDIVREIYINESAGDTRLAIVENGRLAELHVQRSDHQRMVGNIYKGVVENVIPGMQAAFVDIGFPVNAFLPFSEIGNPERLNYVSFSEDDDDTPGSQPAAEPERSPADTKRATRGSRPGRAREKPRTRSGGPFATPKIDLKTGQEIMVQVIKEPFGGKGPRVTTDLAIPGRLLVLVHNAEFVGISRKISDKYEARRLRKIVEALRPESFGIIVRTVAEGRDQKVITKDFKRLWAAWEDLKREAASSAGPLIAYRDMATADSVVRDFLGPDVDKVIIDSKDIHKRLTSYLKDVSPSHVNLVEYYRGRAPIFSNHEIESQIEKCLQSKVWLKSGAHLILDQTEAMMVVDVNSGRFIGKRDHELNSLKINLEAAREVAVQLRLRDIGGLIIIDFIDMREEANRRKVYNELVKELKKDRAKVAVSPISEFGLLEMTRERIRESLLNTLSDECSTCNGLGRVATKDTMITRIDNWIRRFRAKHNDRRLIITVHPDLAQYLEETKTKVVKNLMWRNWTWLGIESDSLLAPDEFRVYSKRRQRDVTQEV